MNTLYLSTTGNDSTGRVNDPAFPWKTLAAVVLRALPGDTISMQPNPDGSVAEFSIVKETYGLDFPNDVTLVGAGGRTVVTNFAVNGIKPGSRSIFRDFHIYNKDTTNRQWAFRAVSGWSFQGGVWIRILARGDTDVFQAGGDKICSGSFLDCDFESHNDCFIASTADTLPSLFVIEGGRYAAIGPGIHDPAFLPQTINLAGNSQLIMRNSQIITTYKAVLQTPGTFLQLVRTPRTDPNGGPPPVEFDTRTGNVQTLLVMD